MFSEVGDTSEAGRTLGKDTEMLRAGESGAVSKEADLRILFPVFRRNGGEHLKSVSVFSELRRLWELSEPQLENEL